MIQGTVLAMGTRRMANMTFTNGKKVISLTIDNGTMPEEEDSVMKRADLRLYNGKEDVTTSVFGGTSYAIVHANVDSMTKAMQWLQRSSWGMETA